MNSSLEDLWCADCGKNKVCVCRKHGALHRVQDAAIPSRARLTLPPSLNLKAVKEQGKTSSGVFSKRIIPVRSQFGPLDAPVISRTKVEAKETKEERRTVWKKKHAMQKVQEASTFAQPADQMETQPSTGAGNQSVTEVSSVSSIQKQDELQSMMSDVAAEQHSQNGLSLGGHTMVNPGGAGDAAIDSLQSSNLQAIQQQLQTSPLHIQTTTGLQHLQLPSALQDFPPISFPSPSGGMQIQVTAENLQTLQQQLQSYSQQTDLSTQANLASLNGMTQAQAGFDGMSLPNVVALTTGDDVLSEDPPPEPESQSTDDSGVADTSQTTMSDSLLVDGPSDADLDESMELDLTYELKVVTDDGFIEQLDMVNEDQSNWMIFVRPAKTVAEQNLIAYQEDGHIFYVSLKPIPTNTELKVWYSPEYAKSLGKGSLPDESQTLAIDGEGHTCPTCKLKFQASSELEKHVCAGKVPQRKVTGRRKGRPRKYVKPTKTWRAKLEKSRLKSESLQSTVKATGGAAPRGRGRPRTKPLVIKGEKVEEKTGGKAGGSGETNSEKKLVAKAEKEKKKRGPKTHREPLACPHCSLTFVAEAAYHVHVFTHTGIKPFICDYQTCSKGFMSKFKLERHRLIHTCPRHHKCPYCDKSFNRKDHLKNHLITHDPNKKIWKCETCNKEYSYNFSYRTHMAYHAAEAGLTLKCQICKRDFDTKEELLFHLKVHTGARAAKNATEKTHQCFECGKKFFTRKDVKRHMITHTKRKDFLCQFCPQRFGRKDHLSRHLRTSHTGDQTTRQRRPPGEGHGHMSKRRERALMFDKMEPTMVPIPIAVPGGEEEQQIIAAAAAVTTTVGSQGALLQNLQYAVTNTIGGQPTREIQIPAAMYEAVAAAAGNPNQQVSLPLGNLQSAPGMSTMNSNTSTQVHYALNEKGYVMNTPQQGHAAVRQMEPGVEYRAVTHALPGTNMYLNPPPSQQQQAILAATAAMAPKDQQSADINNRSNGVLQPDYVPVPRAVVAASDQVNRPSVLCGTPSTAGGQTPIAGDPRQNPGFSTLLGYMETLRFLENLPTNNPGVIPMQLQNLNVEVTQGPQTHLIPVSAYATASSLSQNVSNQNELAKALSHSHHLAAIPNQNELAKNMVAISHGHQIVYQHPQQHQQQQQQQQQQ